MHQQPDLAERLAAVGVRVPDVLIPNAAVDLERWAVIACDQHTSQPGYWDQVQELVGDAPSTLRLTFPEVYLEDPDANHRISRINASMRNYLGDNVLGELPATMVLVRRDLARGATRWGLMVCLDLEQYSWSAQARTLIRATEGTILDRLPPRVAIRRDAAIELPHIMVLINDAARTVIEPLAAQAESLTHLYSTELMLSGGLVHGWAVDSPAALDQVATALHTLVPSDEDPFLFAMGDGNHSFATAKSLWDELKQNLSEQERETHPARHCLVELVNLYDEGLTFEPIHRVLFGLARGAFEAELAGHCGNFTVQPATSLDEVTAQLEAGHRFGLADADGLSSYEVHDPDGTIPAATVQNVINALVDQGAATVDYIHGTDVTAEIGCRAGNLGIFLPGVAKQAFFDAIAADGALPRKTFSMGEAEEKRYYLEARRIR